MYNDLSRQFIGPFSGHSFWKWPPFSPNPNIMEAAVKSERFHKEVLSHLLQLGKCFMYTYDQAPVSK